MAVCSNCGESFRAGTDRCPACGTAVADGDSNAGGGRETTAGQGGNQSDGPARRSAQEDRPSTGRDETGFRSLVTPARVVYIGTLVVAMGTFMPWIEITFVSGAIRGIETDGKYLLGLAVVVAAYVLAGDRDWLAAGGSVLGGLFVAFVGVRHVLDPLAGKDFESDAIEAAAAELVDPLVGLYVTAIGGAVMAVGGVWLWVRR